MSIHLICYHITFLAVFLPFFSQNNAVFRRLPPCPSPEKKASPVRADPSVDNRDCFSFSPIGEMMVDTQVPTIILSLHVAGQYNYSTYKKR
jgi:hypothetical protein